LRKGYRPWYRLPRPLRRAGGLAVPVLLVVLASLILRPMPSTGAPPSPDIRAATLSPVLSQDNASSIVWGLSVPGGGNTGFTLSNGSTWGIYNSPIYQADFSFNAVALSWNAQVPEGSQIVLEIRASPDGQQWSEWFVADDSKEEQSANGSEYHSQLIVATGRYVRYSATLYAANPDLSPTLSDVRVLYIDSSQGPSVTKAQGVGPARRPADMTTPPIISRAGWGSPEPSSSTRWPPSYREWKKVALHDTVTKNNDPNPAATVRAIWYYHANTLGWGDIGYNYLIDPYGNIYEGRFGGENATGGHVLACYNPGSIGIAFLGDYRYAEMPQAMSDALESLMAAKTYQHNINPLGAGDFGGSDDNGAFWQLWLPNIFSHRDLAGSCGNNHSDPGTLVYNRSQEFRDATWNLYPIYGETWVDSSSPNRMLAGSSTSVAVTVRNTGTAVWSNDNNFRLGYRWYSRDGAEVTQAGGGYQRAHLPQDIPFGQAVMINAQITAPASPGTYTLQWDMVQEGVTWFAQQSNSPLNVTVTVNEPTYIAQFAGQSGHVRFFPGDTRVAYFDLKNTGTATWYRSGQNYIRLGTFDPPDRSSPIATAGDWANPTRASYMDQEVVQPGQTARFTFIATAPAQPGVYSEHFSLVAEGKTWFGPNMYLDFTVLPSRKLYLPELLQRYLGSW